MKKLKPHMKLVEYGRSGYFVWAVYSHKGARRPYAMCRVFTTACKAAAKRSPVK